MLFSIVIVLFIAIFILIWLMLYGLLIIKESPKLILKRRLRIMAADKKNRILSPELKAEILKEGSKIEEIFLKIPFMVKLEKLIIQAGLRINGIKFISICLLIIIAGFLISFILTGNYLISLIVCIISGTIPFGVLVALKKRRIRKFTEQFPDALIMMSRSLKAGHSLTSAMQLISQDMAEPIAGLFRIVYEQQMLGLGVRESLATMMERMESVDLRFFITAVTLHHEIGGNLAEILDKLAHTIRERLRIRREVRVFTAQARLSGYVLSILPVATFAIFYMLLPHYEEVLIKTRMGIYLLLIALAAQIAGYLIMRKITNIRI